MRAVRFHEYGDPSVLQIDEVPRPEPKPGEVLVRVAAAGVNPMDWKLRSGIMKQWIPLDLPSTPGYDLAGTVEGVGPGVTDFSPGDEVFGRGTGTYAEYALAPADTLARKPAGLTFEQAATLAVGGVTAWAALFDTAGLQPGQRLLVHGGAGGVGSMAVQLGHWKGAHVAATASGGNVDFVRSIGADEAIDYTATTFEDLVGDVDVVVDTVGGDVAARSWSVMRPGGILVAVAGMPDPGQAAAHGVRASGVVRPEVTRPILEEIAGLIEEGLLVPEVGRVFPFPDVAEAHAVSESGHGRGRIVLQVSD